LKLSLSNYHISYCQELEITYSQDSSCWHLNVSSRINRSSSLFVLKLVKDFKDIELMAWTLCLESWYTADALLLYLNAIIFMVDALGWETGGNDSPPVYGVGVNLAAVAGPAVEFGWPV